MFAIAAHADEREAYVREVERFGEDLPDGSYSKRNRQAISAREIRVAARLRAVEQIYRTTAEHDTMFWPIDSARALRFRCTRQTGDRAGTGRMLPRR